MIIKRFNNFLYIVTNKLFGQLLEISSTNFILLKTFIQRFHILKHGLQIKIVSN